MMSSKEILEFITENEKITLSKLSQLMGIKRAQPLYDIRDGKIKAISVNYADKILAVFPEYSRAWLITGEGQPFSKNENEENADEDNVMAKNKTTERWLEVISKLKAQKVVDNDVALSKSVHGLTKQKMYNIRIGDNGVKLEILEAFFEAYPQVNANYILTGKGNMFLNSESPSLLSKEEVEGMPSPESAEYWERMYKSAVTTYEAMLQNLEERFNALDKPLKDIRELLVERKAV